MKNLEQDRNISQEDFERLIEAVVSRINEREKEPGIFKRVITRIRSFFTATSLEMFLSITSLLISSAVAAHVLFY